MDGYCDKLRNENIVEEFYESVRFLEGLGFNENTFNLPVRDRFLKQNQCVSRPYAARADPFKLKLANAQ